MSGVGGLGRRRFVQAAAGTTVMVPLLGACGGEEEVSAPQGARGEAIVPAAEVPVGGGVIVDGDPAVVVTQPEEGTFKAFSAICTHQGCTVTNVDTEIVCQCHMSRFTLTDGAVVSGPADEPLPSVEVMLDGDQVVFA